MIAHAGLIARRVAGGWRGVLIEGPSGVGKSDLALRCLGAGWRLVADDRTRLFNVRGRLFGRAPPALRGLIEVRGVGIAPHPCLDYAEVRLAVRCVAAPEAVERMPDPAVVTYLACAIPTIAVWPREHSAPAKLLEALEHLGGLAQQGYQAGRS